MSDLVNGFTGFGNRSQDSDFESAAEASRRLREREAFAAEAYSSGWSPATPQAAPEREVSPIGAFQFERDAAESMPPVESIPFDYAQLDAVHEVDRRWSWLEIDLAAIRHNVAETRRFLQPRVRMMAVVKADGYGHGAVEVSRAALGAGADRLAVSTVSEGVALRAAGIAEPIALLDQPPITSIPLLLGYNITPAIYEPDFAVAYGETADLHGVMAPYHLAVNTGMNRLGVSYADVAEFLLQVSFHRALELEGVFTQFSSAESFETLDFEIQRDRFYSALDSIQAAGFDPGIIHAANSAATCRFPDVHFDMVRCGSLLYGVNPCDFLSDRVDLRPAMSVHARIVDARNLSMSEGVSFGMRYRSPGSVRVCTVPVGYADGLARTLSGSIDFIMGGRYHRQVGAICMDHSMFEVDLRPRLNVERLDPQVGDEVIIVGSQGVAEITVEELAQKANTVPYEILVNFGQRMPRVYL